MTSAPARTVVLDDDPTGTQSVSGLPIVLSPDLETLRSVADGSAGPVWVLTNTRAMDWAAAEIVLAGVVERVRAVMGPSTRLVLRGDSTLRGHVLEEIDLLSSPDSVALFVPAFIEEGRVTVGGVHYLTTEAGRVEVAATEYATDPEFAYATSDLVQWVQQRQSGRPAVGLSLETLRRDGPKSLTDLLLTVPAGTVVVPDGETAADIAAIAAGWSAAQERRPVVLRCSSSLASAVTESSSKPIRLQPVSGPVLVLCASYTSGATAQLAALVGLDGVAVHQLDVTAVLSNRAGSARYLDGLAGEVAGSLAASAITVLCTPRSPTAAVSFRSGEEIMDALVTVVRALSGRYSALVTKGGITSARIARDGLGVRVAQVQGQVYPGIPVWALDQPVDRPLQQVVVPGNVGSPAALRDIVQQLTAR